jgi:hypothetical protein
MGIFIKIILSITLVALLFGGIAVYPTIQAGLSHMPAVFDLIAGNLKNMAEVFPAYDLVLAVSAVFAVEGLILIYKFGRWVMSFFK